MSPNESRGALWTCTWLLLSMDSFRVGLAGELEVAARDASRVLLYFVYHGN